MVRSIEDINTHERNDSVNTISIHASCLNATRPSQTQPVGPRFQVITEFSEGVCVPTYATNMPMEAIESFLQKSPMCEEGDIMLFDRENQRPVASVKWRIRPTELGLQVPQRDNLFHDWQLGLLAFELQTNKAATLSCG